MEERRAYLTGRLHFWESHVRRLERGEITAHHAMHDIRSLFLAVLAYKGRLEVLEAERRLLDGDLDIPQIQALAQYMREPESGSPDLLMRIKYGLLSLLQRRRAKSKSAQELALANLIQFMEEQLEITHDNGNR
jgi:hypothetical protein